jgi:hypothetical protein
MASVVRFDLQRGLDPAAGGLVLAGHAGGIDVQQDVHNVPGPLGDLSGGRGPLLRKAPNAGSRSGRPASPAARKAAAGHAK